MRRSPPPQKFTSHSPKQSNLPWEITIAGELNEHAGELIDKLVQIPWGSAGFIFFDTGGGSAYAGLAMATVMKLRGLQATGVVAGECSSAALLPFAACTRRIVTPLSSLFFHPMRWQSEEDIRLDEAVEWTRHFRDMEGNLDELLAKLFNIPLETITHWTHPGKFLRGQDLVTAGIAELVEIHHGDLRKQLQLR